MSDQESKEYEGTNNQGNDYCARDDGSYSYDNYNDQGEQRSSYDKDTDGEGTYEDHEKGSMKVPITRVMTIVLGMMGPTAMITIMTKGSRGPAMTKTRMERALMRTMRRGMAGLRTRMEIGSTTKQPVDMES
eukprot:GFUD01087683.1.p1 GENE.GFUD01087683.1~~GFUD01087683.1.p1  ORF type:complete len:132 (-),score=25.53 GFUD01087683.1:121-516(-)